MQELAQKHGVALLRSNETTCTLMGSLISVLNLELAPRITRHGVLVEVYGEGILILGDSGIGKSELAIELVKRGHRLVADDAVELRKVSNRQIMGTAPENTPLRTTNAPVWKTNTTTFWASAFPAPAFRSHRAAIWLSCWKLQPSTTARRRWVTTQRVNC